LRSYETIFILKPGLGDESVKKHAEKVQGLITGNDGCVVSVEDWGEKKLSYTIEKQKYGHYFLIVFKSNPDFVSRLEKQYLLNEDIIRHSILLCEIPEIKPEEEKTNEEEVDNSSESTNEEKE